MKTVQTKLARVTMCAETNVVAKPTTAARPASLPPGKPQCLVAQFFLLLCLYATALIVACAPRIALYNETAYGNAISLKVECLALMEKAVDSVGAHTGEIEELRMKIEKAHQYVKWLPRNELTVKQWEILMDPEAGLLGTFLNRWQAEGALSKVSVREARTQVTEAFDSIINLETGKTKSTLHNEGVHMAELENLFREVTSGLEKLARDESFTRRIL